MKNKKGIVIWLIAMAISAVLFFVKTDEIPKSETGIPTTTQSADVPTTAEKPAAKAPVYRMPKGLKGKVCAVLLFVDDEESFWTAKEAAKYEKEKIQPGIAFIMEQAASYGAELDLSSVSYVTTEDRPIYYDGIIGTNFTIRQENGKPRYYSDHSKNTGLDKIIERVAANWGFASVNEFNQAMLDYTGAERIGYVVIANKRGWANASCSYAKNPGGGEPTETYFPHEFLHLFAAEDLYTATKMDGTVQRKNRAAMTEKLHRNAIMYSKTADVDDAIVCPYNAYHVGWLEEMPEVYNCEEWYS